MKFKLSGNMLRFANNQDQVEVDAHTVEAGLRALCKKMPDLKQVLLDGEGHFRQVHKIFLNGEQLDHNHMDHKVKKQDEVTILTAIAGG